MAATLCQCGCGEPAPVATYTNARRGYLRGEPVRFVHGHNVRGKQVPWEVHGHNRKRGRSPTYQSWRSMIARCFDENGIGYHNYGGRGISVCEPWWEFSNFLRDMGERPEGKTLDRIDNDGDYEPDNCRWATRSEQQRNKRRRVVV